MKIKHAERVVRQRVYGGVEPETDGLFLPSRIPAAQRNRMLARFIECEGVLSIAVEEGIPPDAADQIILATVYSRIYGDAAPRRAPSLGDIEAAIRGLKGDELEVKQIVAETGIPHRVVQRLNKTFNLRSAKRAKEIGMRAARQAHKTPAAIVADVEEMLWEKDLDALGTEGIIKAIEEKHGRRVSPDTVKNINKACGARTEAEMRAISGREGARKKLTLTSGPRADRIRRLGRDKALSAADIASRMEAEGLKVGADTVAKFLVREKLRTPEEIARIRVQGLIRSHPKATNREYIEYMLRHTNFPRSVIADRAMELDGVLGLKVPPKRSYRHRARVIAKRLRVDRKARGRVEGSLTEAAAECAFSERRASRREYEAAIKEADEAVEHWRKFNRRYPPEMIASLLLRPNVLRYRLIELILDRNFDGGYEDPNKLPDQLARDYRRLLKAEKIAEDNIQRICRRLRIKARPWGEEGGE